MIILQSTKATYKVNDSLPEVDKAIIKHHSVYA